MIDNIYSITLLKKMSFGRLTVISELEPKIYHYAHRDAKARMMLCKCDCGKTVNVSLNNLLRSHTVSCGCYRIEYAIKVLNNYRSMTSSK